MDDDKPKLPGNHGQFGTNVATEDYPRLDDKPAAEPQPDEGTHPGDEGPSQTNAGDRS